MDNKKKIGAFLAVTAVVCAAVISGIVFLSRSGKASKEADSNAITDLPMATPVVQNTPTGTPLPTVTPEPEPAQPDGWVIVVSNELRVRTEMNTECEVLEMATFGMEFEWIRDMSSEDWAAIRYKEDVVAYMAAKYVEIRENADMEEPEPTEEPDVTPTENVTPTPTEKPATASPAPTKTPTATPTKVPAKTPTATPTKAPAKTPTVTPTKAPAKTPTATPTKVPAKTPTATPTKAPAKTPTVTPTKAPTKTPTPTPSSDSTFLPTDAKDEDMLTVLIYTEAGWPEKRDVQYQEMVAIGRVVINRMRSSRWPSSMYDVIHQKGQFSVVRSGRLLSHYNKWMDKSYQTLDAAWRYEMCNKAAKEVLSGGSWDFDYEFFRDSRGYENYYQRSVIIGQTVFHNGVKK